MRFAAISAVLFLVGTLSAQEARAANKLIAVLPLDVSHAKQKLDADAQASLEEMLRDVATEALASQGWTVLATQNMLQTLRDNGVDPTTCGEADCQLSTARELKADKFISGAVQWVEGDFTASIRLIDTKSGSIIASAGIEGESVKALRRAFEKKAADFFMQGQLISGQQAPGGTSEPPPAVTSTGPRVNRTKVTAALGTLTVTAKPRDSVRIDLQDPEGKKFSSGIPYDNKSAKPGTWKVTARASGYGDEEQTVQVAPDDVTLVRFDLQLLGGLSIQGTPSGAAVTVTGPARFHDEGGIPWEATGLQAGRYRVHVTREGYADHDEQVEVKPGETATVQIALQKAAAVVVSREPEAKKAVDEDETHWRFGGLAGILGVSSMVLPTLGGEAEWRMTKSLSYFVDAGVTIPLSRLQVGFAYSLGVRYLLFDGLHLGVLIGGWVGGFSETVGPATSSTSVSLSIASGEIGYVFNWGAFSLGVEARVGYLFSATVAGSSASSTGDNAVAYGVSLVPAFRF